MLPLGLGKAIVLAPVGSAIVYEAMLFGSSDTNKGHAG